MKTAGRSPGNRGPPSFLSRRAHLLTTCKSSGGMPTASCALRGGCGFRSISYCWKHYGQCHISAELLSLSTQSAVVSVSATTANCLRKFCQEQIRRICSTALSQIWAATRRPFSFCKKETKTEDERTVRANGDLPLGSKGCKPRKRTVRCCGIRLSELYQHSE